jgi:quercetin dioxygenase-like cupin family protein
MTEETILRRGHTLVRRLRLEPGEATAWHRDPHHRVSVIVRGDALSIEYRDGGPGEQVAIAPGEAGWDEPTERVHRGVNTGTQPYEEVTVYFLAAPDAAAQLVEPEA